MLTLINFLVLSFPNYARGDLFFDQLHRWTSFLISPQPSSAHRLSWSPPSSSSAIRRPPITSDSCKGLFPWTCLCQPEVIDSADIGRDTSAVRSIACLDARLTDTDVLASLRQLPALQSATFNGNNFLEFPDRILGSGKHKTLSYLNMSGNNVLYLSQDAFVGMASLQSLDLSDNALYLREESGDWLFLRPLRFLRRLVLKGAFRKPLLNASAQLILLERGMQHARLHELQFLDLSDNDFDYFPPTLVCRTKGLTHLILASNRLRTLHLSRDCPDPVDLKALDLRGNRIKYFDQGFIASARHHHFGPASVRVADNQLDCRSSNCESLNMIRWFKTTPVIKDKETVRCQARRVSEDDDYRADSYLLYVPSQSTLNCAEKPTTAKKPVAPTPARPRPTTKTTLLLPPEETLPPTTTESIDEENLASYTLLIMAGDNETSANNSANALLFTTRATTTAIAYVFLLPFASIFVPSALFCYYYDRRGFKT